MTTNQDHEDAASSEMAWFKCGPFDGDGPNGYDAWWTIEEAGEHGRMLAEVYDEAITDRIIADHGLAAWAVRAREALEKIANKHSSFSSHCQEVDTHQLARAALAGLGTSPAGVDLALVRSTLESKIKDDRYHPQYILGMAFAHQLLESVAAAPTEAGQ